MERIRLDRESRFDKINFCYKKCINSFKEKPLSPYEKECLYPCLENQVSIGLEIHNNLITFNELKAQIRKYHKTN